MKHYTYLFLKWTKKNSLAWAEQAKYPILFGLILRLISAAWGYGWFAADDYEYALGQASIWFQNSHLPYACDIRSSFFPRIFWSLLNIARYGGIHSPIGMLQYAYAILGVFNVLAIWGTICLCRLHSTAKEANYAGYTIAAFAFLPRIATRALVEVVAMVPLVWATFWLEKARIQAQKKTDLALKSPSEHFSALWGGMLLGATFLLRVQTIVLSLPMFLRLPAKKSLRIYFCLGFAFVGFGVQALFDIMDGRYGLSTPWRYVYFNWFHSRDFGVSPWYTYLWQFLWMTLPPLSLYFLPFVKKVIQTHQSVSIYFFFFVFSHMLFSHKEDRFMFPILPLYILLFSQVLYTAIQLGKTRVRWAVHSWWFANTLVLIVAMFSDGQRSSVHAALSLAHKNVKAEIVAIGLNPVPEYYWYPKYMSVKHYQNLDAWLKNPTYGHYLLLQPAPQLHHQDEQKLLSMGCYREETFHGDWVDRLLVRWNRHHRRRTAIGLYDCAKKNAFLSRTNKLGM